MAVLGAIAVAIAALGATIADGLIVSSTVKSMARQPEMEGKLRTTMIMGIAFVEGTFFVALAMAFIFR